MFEAGAAEQVYRLRVVLAQVSPLIWRRLEVTGSITLTGLHEVHSIAGLAELFEVSRACTGVLDRVNVGTAR